MRLTLWAAAAVGVLAPASVRAEIIGHALGVSYSSSLGSGTMYIEVGDGTYNPATGDFVFSLAGPVVLADAANGQVIAHLAGLSLTVRGGFTGDPQIALGFAMTAGGADTFFSVASGQRYSERLAAPQAVVSMTLTDTGGGPGAWTSGQLGFDPLMYRSYEGYFGSSFYIGDDLVAGDGGTASATTPPFGPQPLHPTDSMTAQFGFRASAGDSVSGTSVFTLVPAPGAALVLAGLIAARRRKRH